jgi:hypothetical protein
MSHGLHFLQRAHQSLVLALLVCLDQSLPARWTGKLIDIQRHTDIGSNLRTCAESRGLDRFVLVFMGSWNEFLLSRGEVQWFF